MDSSFSPGAAVDRRDATDVDGLRAALVAAARQGSFRFPASAASDRQFEFLGFVAHELRNPLTPIRNMAALLTQASPEELQRAQVVIERQVAQMTRMIDDLLDMTRGRTGKLRVVLEAVELPVVVEQSVAACQDALSRRGQRVEISGLAGAGALRADGMRLTQIVTNLVDNASKFSPAGATVRIDVRALGRSVELAVSDTGMGMDAATLASVFDPFAQATQAAGFNSSGLGIGLAVVRQLAESHGGQVVAESRGLGCGSRFVVTLPAMTASEGECA